MGPGLYVKGMLSLENERVGARGRCGIVGFYYLVFLRVRTLLFEMNFSLKMFLSNAYTLALIITQVSQPYPP